MDQARYATYVVTRYLDAATIKEQSNFHKTTLPYDIIFTKEYASTSDVQVEVLSIFYNIHYRACVRSLIYLLFIGMCLYFSVHKLTKFSSDPGQLNFEGFC